VKHGNKQQNTEEQTMKQPNSFYILSSNRAQYSSAVNRNRYKRLLDLLIQRNIPAIQCLGVWQGEYERSVWINAYKTDFPEVMKLAREFDQESVLYVFDGDADLIAEHPDGIGYTQKRIGVFTYLGDHTNLHGHDGGTIVKFADSPNTYAYTVIA
jgi:hypothetical protein